ncbi:MAG: FG-GAP-like repeat-containing protein [Acidobacteriota bacterium]
MIPLRLRWVAALPLMLLAACGPNTPVPPTSAFVQAMNEGKAYLENKDSTKALEAFGRAVAEAPRSAPALRNRARAELLARQHDVALVTLQEAEKLDPDSAATAYLTGITLVRETRFEEALPRLEEAVRIDPEQAPLRFQLANVYQALERHDEAVGQLREAVRIDPLHASAHFKLATYARQNGDREEAMARQREFLRLRELQGEEARSAEALEISSYTRPEAAPAQESASTEAPVLAFTDRTGEWFPDLGDRASEIRSAAIVEVNAEGRASLLTVDDDGGLDLWQPEGAAYRRAELPSAIPAFELVVGNFHDAVPEDEPYDPKVHAHNDVLLLTAAGPRLLLATGANAFEDVTGDSGLAGLEVESAAWVDFDHDGDLDLLLAAGERGQRLFQNGGDLTFTDMTDAVGLPKTEPQAAVAAVDLNGDVAVDLIVAHPSEGTAVYDNQRAGSFAERPDPPGFWPPARRILIDDFDNDTRPDALLLSVDSATLVEATERANLGLGTTQAAAAIDADNDGWLDLATVTEDGSLRLWRNGGEAGWSPWPGGEALAVGLTHPSDLIAADLDGDGDSDLLASGMNGLRALSNESADLGRQIKLRLIGTKTNPGGIGTHIEVRAGDLRVVREVSGPVVELGVGDAERLDSVQTLWTNGVVDNQVDVAVADSPFIIDEKNVATGSCPFLYAWDESEEGAGYRFITDLLGNSPLGLSYERGKVLPADPDEYVWIGSLTPRAGAYELAATSEFRELFYFDYARLEAIDHPPGVEVHPTDKLMPPPFPKSEVWALSGRRPLRQATAADGTDRTAVLAELDGDFMDPGVLRPPPYRGLVFEQSTVLDFGEIETDRRWVLALTGWLQYGDASTNIAISQNSEVHAVAPHLEAEVNGRWQPVDVVVGVPAGKTKTLLVDLAGQLPAGSERLRLSTTLEIRWDRAALFERFDGAVTSHGAEPETAHLYGRGFSDLRSRAANHPTTPDWRQVAEKPPWRGTPQGWVTRYGEVVELLTERDGQMAILNAGDAVTLRFDTAAFPSPAEGQERTFFFYSVGWDKDSDHNVLDGDRVEPLPAEANLDGPWRLEYNTRWVAADHFTDGRSD